METHQGPPSRAHNSSLQLLSYFTVITNNIIVLNNLLTHTTCTKTILSKMYPQSKEQRPDMQLLSVPEPELRCTSADLLESRCNLSWLVVF